ncbi:MAG: tRNA lysidine(34) synthetase TilS [Desulfobulbales bacterium]
MHPLVKKTLEIIRQEKLLCPGEKIIVAVSGGPDSMALLHVLANLASVMHLTLTAAYLNHGLRPVEARKEKSLVEDESKRLGINFVTAKVDVKAFAANSKISIEHGARVLRYDFLEKTAQVSGAQKICLAHTADDQAEEILLRLIRGTARKGLSGMKTLRAGKFIRPFLQCPKSLLLDFLTRYSIPFLIDSSNLENIYLRNRIRNEMLPYLEAKFNPEIRQTLLRTAAILQDEEELLGKITEAAFNETVSVYPETFTKTHDDSSRGPGVSYPRELHIDLRRFQHHPRAIQRRILEKCCWLMSSQPRSRLIENLLQLAIPDSTGSILHLAHGLRVSRKKELMCFEYPKGQGPFRGNLTSENEIEFPEIVIPGPGIYDFPTLNKKLVVEYVKDFIPGAGGIFQTGEYLDADLFSFPLILKGPEEGDRFHPLGAPGTKKVSDFLSERKIEKSQRRIIPVLTTDDTILALPGLRIDHDFRVTERTTRVLRVRWEKRG